VSSIEELITGDYKQRSIVRKSCSSYCESALLGRVFF
jgi:hypothetical protein